MNCMNYWGEKTGRKMWPKVLKIPHLASKVSSCVCVDDIECGIAVCERGFALESAAHILELAACAFKLRSVTLHISGILLRRIEDDAVVWQGGQNYWLPPARPLRSGLSYVSGSFSRCGTNEMLRRSGFGLRFLRFVEMRVQEDYTRWKGVGS